MVNTTEQIDVRDAKARLREILARIEQRDDFVIARSGTPITGLSAIGERQRRGFGFVSALTLSDGFSFDPLPEDECELWEGR